MGLLTRTLAAALLVAAAGCALEYELMTQGRLGPAEVLAVLGAGSIPLAAAAHPLRFTTFAAWILWAVLVAASVQALFAPDRERAPTRIAHVVTGCLYAGLGLGPIAALVLGTRASWPRVQERVLRRLESAVLEVGALVEPPTAQSLPEGRSSPA